jgi:hypothetical protein
VLSAQFLEYIFKLIGNVPVSVILSNFNWKSGKKKLIFSFNFLYVLSLCMGLSYQHNRDFFPTNPI